MDSVKCAAPGREVPGQHQEQLTQTWTVCVLKRNVIDPQIWEGYHFCLDLLRPFPMIPPALTVEAKTITARKSDTQQTFIVAFFTGFGFKGQIKPMSNVIRQNQTFH